MAQRDTLRCRSNRQETEIEEINDGNEKAKELPPMRVMSVPSSLNTAIDGFRSVFSDLQGMFAALEQDEQNALQGGKENSSELPMPSANHPGIEHVDMAEAMEQCPHLKEIMAKKKQEGGEHQGCDHPYHSAAGQSEGSCPEGGKQAKESKCPVDHKGMKTASVNPRCPYQDPEAHEWPMRAVLTFLAFNFIATGVSIEIVKIGFVAMACYTGMLRGAEFAVLYVTTASMSSYKLLGLLLMLTNKGGPKWDPKMYRISPATVAGGVLTGVLAIGVAMLAKQGEIAYGFYRPPPWTGPPYAPHISPLFNLVVPILNEFVYRQYMLTELGRDLGTWFGLLGSSIWYGVMLKAGKPKLLANFFQGLFFGSAMLLSKKNLAVPTIAHAVYRIAFSLFPSLNQFVVQ